MLAIIPLNLDGYLFKWQSSRASILKARLAADYTGWEKDNAKFEEQFEKVVKALRRMVGRGARSRNRGSNPSSPAHGKAGRGGASSGRPRPSGRLGRAA